MSKCKYEVPFDIHKSAKDNLLEWVGEDDRIMQLVNYAELHEVKLRYCPGTDWCYIDVLTPLGSTIAFGEAHSMVIDLGNDRITLFGSDDIPSGIAKIDEIYAKSGKFKTDAEFRSLYSL